MQNLNFEYGFLQIRTNIFRLFHSSQLFESSVWTCLKSMEMQFNKKKSTWKGSGGKINYFKYVNRLQMVKKVLASCRAFLMLKNTSWKNHVLPGQVSDKSDRFPEWTGRNQYLFNKFKFKRGGNKNIVRFNPKQTKCFLYFW